MHPEDIKAAIRKKGVTLTALAELNDLPKSACRVALIKPYFTAETVIAEFLELPPKDLWPDRYDKKGLPLQPRIRSQIISRRGDGHCQKGLAA